MRALVALALLLAACDSPEEPPTPDLSVSTCGGARAGPCEHGQTCADPDGLGCMCNAYLAWMCTAAPDLGTRD